MTRKIDPLTFWRVARSTLARLACEYADPADRQHDHTVCVRDDASYAADLLLRVAAAAAGGDEGTMLDRLSDLREATSEEPGAGQRR